MYIYIYIYIYICNNGKHNTNSDIIISIATICTIITIIIIITIIVYYAQPSPAEPAGPPALVRTSPALGGLLIRRYMIIECVKL